jgi:hypothetical protein
VVVFPFGLGDNFGNVGPLKSLAVVDKGANRRHHPGGRLTQLLSLGAKSPHTESTQQDRNKAARKGKKSVLKNWYHLLFHSTFSAP